MWANAFQYFVLAFDSLVLVGVPILFELAAGLLVDFLLDIELSLVEHSDVVGQDRNFDLWAFSPIERWLPSLDEEA